MGYNYGAGNYERVRGLLKAVMKWTALVGIGCMILFEAFPAAFIRLFGSDGAAVYGVCSPLSEKLFIADFICLCAEGMCNLSAVHRSCTGSSAVQRIMFSAIMQMWSTSAFIRRRIIV